jgi:hypothetical protein
MLPQCAREAPGSTQPRAQTTSAQLVPAIGAAHHNATNPSGDVGRARAWGIMGPPPHLLEPFPPLLLEHKTARCPRPRPDLPHPHTAPHQALQMWSINMWTTAYRRPPMQGRPQPSRPLHPPWLRWSALLQTNPVGPLAPTHHPLPPPPSPPLGTTPPPPPPRLRAPVHPCSLLRPHWVAAACLARAANGQDMGSRLLQ